jgi:hypothetical protein
MQDRFGWIPRNLLPPHVGNEGLTCSSGRCLAGMEVLATVAPANQTMNARFHLDLADCHIRIARAYRYRVSRKFFQSSSLERTHVRVQSL